MIKFHKAIATVIGLGYAPIAPGTFGTIGAVIFLYLVYFLGMSLSSAVLIGIIIISALVGIWSTDQVIPEWGDDPSKVVIDEFVGYLVTMLFVPIQPKYILVAFILFRFFDILKPFGIRYLDKNIKGGTGVMLDDVLAGIYACGCLHLIIRFVPSF